MTDTSIAIALILLIVVAVAGGVVALRFFLRWIDSHTVPAVYTPQRAAEERMRTLRALETARGEYEESLAALKNQPTNPNLRQETLRLGRVYSGLTRQSGGATIYDELALANDISAACAAATSRSVDLPEERLARLAELKGRGLVSEEEFNLKRQAILREL